MQYFNALTLHTLKTYGVAVALLTHLPFAMVTLYVYST